MQSLLGHADLSTTMIYTHVLKVGGGAVRSPLDRLGEPGLDHDRSQHVPPPAWSAGEPTRPYGDARLAPAPP